MTNDDAADARNRQAVMISAGSAKRFTGLRLRNPRSTTRAERDRELAPRALRVQTMGLDIVSPGEMRTESITRAFEQRRRHMPLGSLMVRMAVHPARRDGRSPRLHLFMLVLRPLAAMTPW